MNIKLLSPVIASIAMLSAPVYLQAFEGFPVFQPSASNVEGCGNSNFANLICIDPIPVDPVSTNWITNCTLGSNTTTTVNGISGGVIFGSYVDSSSMTEGFSWDGTNYTTIDNPSSSGFTEIRGFSGGIYAGNFTDSNGVTHGFLFDGTNYTTVDDPEASGYTSIVGYNGGAYVGNYTDTNYVSQGFLYDGTNYTTIVDPDSADGSVYLNGFSDGVIFGSYSDTNYVTHGFLYDGTNYTTIDYPGAPSFTEVTADSGGVVAGNYTDTNGSTHGFLYDGTNYTTVDEPQAASYTTLTGASDTSYVGNYTDTNGSTHGFLYDGTNFTTIDDPEAGQIQYWTSWSPLMFGRVGFPLLLGAGTNEGSFAAKSQVIKVHVTKTATKLNHGNTIVRLVATAPAGGVTFTPSANAVLSSTKSYWSSKRKVYVTTAITTIYGSGNVTVTATQLGNAKFAPAKPVTIKLKVKRPHSAKN